MSATKRRAAVWAEGLGVQYNRPPRSLARLRQGPPLATRWLVVTAGAPGLLGAGCDVFAGWVRGRGNRLLGQ